MKKKITLSVISAVMVLSSSMTVMAASEAVDVVDRSK